MDPYATPDWARVFAPPRVAPTAPAAFGATAGAGPTFGTPAWGAGAGTPAWGAGAGVPAWGAGARGASAGKVLLVVLVLLVLLLLIFYVLAETGVLGEAVRDFVRGLFGAQKCPESGGRECGGRGDCVAGVCRCEDGWEGEACADQTETCPTGSAGRECSGNGSCGLHTVCTCNAGWTGTACDTAVCEQGCGDGSCASPGVCDCSGASPPTDQPCLNESTWIQSQHDCSWTCNCGDENYGDSCEYSRNECPEVNGEVCGGHGACTDFGDAKYCDCDDGYYGADCGKSAEIQEGKLCGAFDYVPPTAAGPGSVSGTSSRVRLTEDGCECTAAYYDGDGVCDTCAAGYVESDGACVPACPGGEEDAALACFENAACVSGSCIPDALDSTSFDFDYGVAWKSKSDLPSGAGDATPQDPTFLFLDGVGFGTQATNDLFLLHLPGVEASVGEPRASRMVRVLRGGGARRHPQLYVRFTAQWMRQMRDARGSLLLPGSRGVWTRFFFGSGDAPDLAEAEMYPAENRGVLSIVSVVIDAEDGAAARDAVRDALPSYWEAWDGDIQAGDGVFGAPGSDYACGGEHRAFRCAMCKEDHLPRREPSGAESLYNDVDVADGEPIHCDSVCEDGDVCLPTRTRDEGVPEGFATCSGGVWVSGGGGDGDGGADRDCVPCMFVGCLSSCEASDLVQERKADWEGPDGRDTEKLRNVWDEFVAADENFGGHAGREAFLEKIVEYTDALHAGRCGSAEDGAKLFVDACARLVDPQHFQPCNCRADHWAIADGREENPVCEPERGGACVHKVVDLTHESLRRSTEVVSCHGYVCSEAGAVCPADSPGAGEDTWACTGHSWEIANLAPGDVKRVDDIVVVRGADSGGERHYFWSPATDTPYRHAKHTYGSARDAVSGYVGAPLPTVSAYAGDGVCDGGACCAIVDGRYFVHGDDPQLCVPYDGGAGPACTTPGTIVDDPEGTYLCDDDLRWKTVEWTDGVATVGEYALRRVGDTIRRRDCGDGVCCAVVDGGSFARTAQLCEPYVGSDGVPDCRTPGTLVDDPEGTYLCDSRHRWRPVAWSGDEGEVGVARLRRVGSEILVTTDCADFELGAVFMEGDDAGEAHLCTSEGWVPIAFSCEGAECASAGVYCLQGMQGAAHDRLCVQEEGSRGWRAAPRPGRRSCGFRGEKAVQYWRQNAAGVWIGTGVTGCADDEEGERERATQLADGAISLCYVGGVGASGVATTLTGTVDAPVYDDGELLLGGADVREAVEACLSVKLHDSFKRLRDALGAASVMGATGLERWYEDEPDAVASCGGFDCEGLDDQLCLRGTTGAEEQDFLCEGGRWEAVADSLSAPQALSSYGLVVAGEQPVAATRHLEHDYSWNDGAGAQTEAVTSGEGGGLDYNPEAFGAVCEDASAFEERVVLANSFGNAGVREIRLVRVGEIDDELRLTLQGYESASGVSPSALFSSGTAAESAATLLSSLPYATQEGTATLAGDTLTFSFSSPYNGVPRLGLISVAFFSPVNPTLVRTDVPESVIRVEDDVADRLDAARSGTARALFARYPSPHYFDQPWRAEEVYTRTPHSVSGNRLVFTGDLTANVSVGAVCTGADVEEGATVTSVARHGNESLWLTYVGLSSEPTGTSSVTFTVAPPAIASLGDRHCYGYLVDETRARGDPYRRDADGALLATCGPLADEPCCAPHFCRSAVHHSAAVSFSAGGSTLSFTDGGNAHRQVLRGQRVSGEGIPEGSFVVSADASGAKISRPTPASGGGVVEFSWELSGEEAGLDFVCRPGACVAPFGNASVAHSPCCLRDCGDAAGMVGPAACGGGDGCGGSCPTSHCANLANCRNTFEGNGEEYNVAPSSLSREEQKRAAVRLMLEHRGMRSDDDFLDGLMQGPVCDGEQCVKLTGVRFESQVFGSSKEFEIPWPSGCGQVYTGSPPLLDDVCTALVSATGETRVMRDICP